MAGTSKISAVFDANTGGFVAGTQRVSAALSKLDRDVAGMRSSLGTLTAISGAQLFGSLASYASQAASGLFSMGKASVDAIGNLVDLAAQSGSTYAEIATLQYAGSMVGLGAEDMSKAVAKMQIAFSKAGSGSKVAEKAFADIGLSFDKLNGNSAAEQFQQVADAIAALPSPAERTAAAVAIFGKSGASLVPLFNSGAGAIKAAGVQLERFGGALTEAQSGEVDALGDSFNTAAVAIRSVVDQVTAHLAPGVRAVVDGFSRFIEEAGGANIGKKISDGIYDGVEVLARTGDWFISGIQAAWEYVAGVVQTFADSVNLLGRAWAMGQAVAQALVGFGAGLVAAFQKVIAVAVSAMAKVAEFIPGGEAWADGLRRFGTQMDTSAKANLDAGQQSFKAAAKSFTQGWTGDFSDGVTKAARAGGGVLESYVEKLRTVADQQGEEPLKKGAASLITASDTAAAKLGAALKPLELHDLRTLEGAQQVYDLRFGNNDVAEKQLDAMRNVEDNTAAAAAALADIETRDID